MADPGMEREFKRRWPELSLRCGAVPFTVDNSGEMQFLLIRRRGEDAWSIPKGCLVRGETMASTAAIKAFEEAGVYGAVDSAPLGSYRHLKCERGNLALPRFVEVVLFPLEVETQVDDWPEMAVRERRWFNRNEVPYFIAPRTLWHLIMQMDPAIPALAMNQ